VDVVLLRWPHEEDRRDDLRHRGLPRLLLVDRDHPAPTVADCLEDWVRMPTSDEDIDARARSVLQRASSHACSRPVLDPDGVLRNGGDWVSLPPVEARLVAALLDRFGAVVSRDQLARAGWPAGAPGRNALDVHVLRVRRRIAPLGLVLTTVRSRGYLLERGAHVADEGVDGPSVDPRPTGAD
jgi:DNA-binding winged helix-turn-helix (wHTH) protein